MKVSELTGPLLDYWTGKAEGITTYIFDGNCFIKGSERDWVKNPHGAYSPSTDWSQGGPIIEREGIAPYPEYPDMSQWSARQAHKETPDYFGPTPLIAAMRCFVASKFGEGVPDE